MLVRARLLAAAAVIVTTCSLLIAPAFAAEEASRLERAGVIAEHAAVAAAAADAAFEAGDLDEVRAQAAAVDEADATLEELLAQSEADLADAEAAADAAATSVLATQGAAEAYDAQFEALQELADARAEAQHAATSLRAEVVLLEAELALAAPGPLRDEKQERLDAARTELDEAEAQAVLTLQAWLAASDGLPALEERVAEHERALVAEAAARAALADAAAEVDALTPIHDATHAAATAMEQRRLDVAEVRALLAAISWTATWPDGEIHAGATVPVTLTLARPELPAVDDPAVTVLAPEGLVAGCDPTLACAVDVPVSEDDAVAGSIDLVVEVTGTVRVGGDATRATRVSVAGTFTLAVAPTPDPAPVEPEVEEPEAEEPEVAEPAPAPSDEPAKESEEPRPVAFDQEAEVERIAGLAEQAATVAPVEEHVTAVPVAAEAGQPAAETSAVGAVEAGRGGTGPVEIGAILAAALGVMFLVRRHEA
ncbi:hypothetical protein [Demequina iriomotensis]|uniref:hypothetical protein n=1 Tax=Demequina iriomotensis TaxID=1536641 RepID=UPI000785A5F1|nr:hypothetical protein [Demequina iriomotensis]